MLAAVDGTGAFTGEGGYGPFTADQMRRTFIYRLVEEVRAQQTFTVYEHGVRLTGFGSFARAEKVVAQVKARLGSKPKEPVYLAGYSRGGAIVIEAARLLMKASIAVTGLVLFDAVSRAPAAPGNLLTDEIPESVSIATHAVRDPAVGSRPMFGNCGLRVANPKKTVLNLRKFRATHSAMGGLPWEGDYPTKPDRTPYKGDMPPYAMAKAGPIPVAIPAITRGEDFAGAKSVELFMWTEMRRMGLLPGGGGQPTGMNPIA